MKNPHEISPVPRSPRDTSGINHSGPDLSEAEIKQLLPPEEYEKYKEKRAAYLKKLKERNRSGKPF